MNSTGATVNIALPASFVLMVIHLNLLPIYFCILDRLALLSVTSNVTYMFLQCGGGGLLLLYRHSVISPVEAVFPLVAAS